MARTAVSVRRATADDLPTLLSLYDEMRAGSGGGRGGSRASEEANRCAVEARYARAVDDPDQRLLLAIGPEGMAFGMALLTVDSASGIVEVPVIQVTHVVVAARHRRRGAGRTLIAAAAAWAEERGIDSVVVTVFPGHREANRYYARLGFAPLVVRRVAPVPVLRRRLGGPDGVAPRPPVPPLLRRRLRVRPQPGTVVAAARRRGGTS